MIKKFERYLSGVDYENQFRKDRNRLTILFSIEIFLIAIILFVQEYVRPKMLFNTSEGSFFMGIFPSFLGSMAYVLVIFAFYKIIQSHYGKYRLWAGLLLANCFTFIGLTIWELIRTVIRNFDWWDIVATLLGCLCATLLILGLYITYKLKEI